LAAGLTYSCSQQDDIISNDTPNEVTPTEVTKGNIKVVFRMQSNPSAPTTRSAEDSYVHTQGTPEEYKVNSARVYLFDSPTKLLVKSFLLSNLTNIGSDADGNVVYETENVMVPQGTYDVFVTANTNRIINKDHEDDFLADIDSITYTRAQIEDISNGIFMTNRASANVSTVITEDEKGEISVVYVELERTLARLDVAKSAEEYALTDKNGTQYASVKLDGFYIVNLPKYFYTFRHCAVLTSLEEPTWSLSTNFGKVSDVNGYVIDPYFFKKKVDASSFTNQDKYYENFFCDITTPSVVKWMSFNAVSQTPNYKTTYSLENCTLAPAQKNGYSTGVLFRAVMEPYNNVYHLNGSTLELINNKQNYPEVLYYYGYRFFDSPEALNFYASGNSSQTDPKVFEAKKFEKSNDGNYHCYYKYWIRHLDNNKPTVMGVMEFGIVRNNLYRMLVTNVSDLGDGDPELIPNNDTPDEGETKLKVILNVKPWIVRDLTNIVL
jgi:hypothetical protein